MKSGKVYIIIAALLISVSIVFLGLSNRYYIDTSTRQKVDKLTGDTYRLKDGDWVKVNHD
jgi:hypothetical protein